MIFLFRFSVYYVFSFMGFSLLAVLPLWLFNRFILGTFQRFSEMRMLSSTEFTWSIVFVAIVGTLYLLIVDSLTSGSINDYLSDTEEIGADHEGLAAVHRIFTTVRDKAKNRRARLYIADRPEVNAYAIQSPSKEAIVLTVPLLNELDSFWQPETSEEQQSRFNASLEGIFAHEFSHLKHQDYLPTWFFYGVIRVADNIRALLVKTIQVLIVVVSLIPFVGVLIGNALAIVTTIVSEITIRLFRSIIPQAIRFFDALPSRIMENRCDRHAANTVGERAIFLGLYALAHVGGVDKFRVLDDHPPTIVRVARAWRKFIEDSRQLRRWIHAARVTNNVVAFASFLFFILVSGTMGYIAADRLGWTNSLPEHQIVEYIDATSETSFASAISLVFSATDRAGSVANHVVSRSRPVYRPLFSVGDRLATVTNGSDQESSDASLFVHRTFVALVALVLFLTVGLWILRFLFSVLLIPYRLALRAKENTTQETPIDAFYYASIDTDSLIGILSLVRNGANKNVTNDDEDTPLRYALKKRKYRLAIHLAM